MAHLLENMVAGTKLAKWIGRYFFYRTNQIAARSIQQCQIKACSKRKQTSNLLGAIKTIVLDIQAQNWVSGTQTVAVFMS